MCEQMEQITNRVELQTYIKLVNKGDLPLEKVAENSGLSVEEFLKKKEEYENTQH